MSILELIDVLFAKEKNGATTKQLFTKTNTFFIEFFTKTQKENTPFLNSLIFVLINFKFICFSQLFPENYVTEKLKFNIIQNSISNIQFPKNKENLPSKQLFEFCLIKLYFSNKTEIKKSDLGFLDSIISQGNLIYSSALLSTNQFEFIRMCVFLIFYAEKRTDLLQESKYEGFVMMSISKLLQAYLKKPEIYFSLIISTINHISHLVRKTFHKESVKQVYYKISLIFFRIYSEVFLYSKSKLNKKSKIREVSNFCNTILINLTQLYNFDVFFSNEDSFIRSSLCKFSSSLIFQVLEEYSLMISLPSIDANKNFDDDPRKKGSIVLRNDNRIEFLTYLFYLQKLAIVCKSIDLNIYLQNQISVNFNLAFLTDYIRKNNVEYKCKYLKVV